jgi:hypothetical protein
MQLRGLVRFLPALERPDFRAGDMVAPRETERGARTMPHATYGETVEAFVRAAYEDGWVLRDFDWPTWMASAEARSLRDDEAALAAATPGQLARLLTVLIRQDRFVEGALLDAFESGLILRIVRRAAAILEADGEAPQG